MGWLALNPGEHPRTAVAAQFWPDVLDASARASLRSAMWNLRQALGTDADDALIATRDRIALRCAPDLSAFDAHLAAGEIEAAVALCRGPLLADFDDDWVLEARDRHTERLAAAFARLANEAPTPDAAVGYARRRLALDPLDEAAARDLMARLAAAGDRAGAFSVYDRLTERLRTQLSLAPSAATREAAAGLRAAAADPAAVEAPALAGRWPLVGRDDELAILLEASATPQGALAVLSGEGGIGKTRIARDVLDRAADDGRRTAACTSLELGGAAPFSLWAELLRELATTLPAPEPEATWPDELAAITPSLPRRLGRDGSGAPPAIVPELARARLFEAAVDAIEYACADRPLVLLFEDLHLADAASLELLAYVARRFAGLPVLAILTRRHTPERADVDALLHSHRSRGGALIEIDVQPLHRDAVDRLVRSVATLGADAREQVIAAADGNPLLAVESARAAAGGHEGSPPTLQAVVRVALGRLTPGARNVAELAAGAGRDLSRREVDALASADDVLGALDTGLFATPGQGFGYRHALLREAALAQLPDARRRALHFELAGALRGPTAETARHLRLAGHDDEAAQRLAHAGNDAIGVGAIGEAIAFLSEAVELRPSDPALLLDLAQAHAWNGDDDASRQALDAALRNLPADDLAGRGAAHARAAQWYSGALCHPQRTVDEAQAALELLAGIDGPAPDILGSALALGAWGEAVAGDTEEADRLLARLDELEPSSASVQLDAANARAFRAMRDDGLEDAMRCFYETAQLTGNAPDRAYTVWVNLSCIAAALGRLQEALDCAESADVLDLPPLVTPLHAIRASLLVRMDRIDEARVALADERDAAERSGLQRLVALADHDEGQFALAAGEYDGAAELLGRALDGGAAVSRPSARLSRAEALARGGRPDEAHDELRQVTLEPVGPTDRPHILVARLTHVQGLIAHARGDDALAAKRLREALASWSSSGPGGPTAASDILANLVDLGRPAVATIEPGREIARIEDELRELDRLTTTTGDHDADIR